MGHGVDRNQAADGSGSSITPIEENIIDAKGDLSVGTAADTAARLAIGANETRLVADSAQAGGLKYVADTTNYAVGAKGDLLVGTAADTVAAKTVGSNGQLLVADSTQSDGLIWTDYTREPINVNPNWLIDQINEGALYTIGSNSQHVDGWSGQTVGAGVFKTRVLADPDNAARKALEISCTTADASLAASDLYDIYTAVEGYDMSDLKSGTASASKITLMFATRLPAGTYGVALQNGAADRSYIATFVQAQAGVRQENTIVIQLDTTGTWLYTNGVGLVLRICLAAGSDFHGTASAWQAGNKTTTSSQANFMSSTSNVGYIGPIHIIPGGVALAYHKQDIERELRRAQRQFTKTFSQGAAVAQASNLSEGLICSDYAYEAAAGCVGVWNLPTSMRAPPTIVTYNWTQANNKWRNSGNTADATTTVIGVINEHMVAIQADTDTVKGQRYQIHATANARLS